MDVPPQPESPKPVDEFGLPPPAPRKPVADDPEPEGKSLLASRSQDNSLTSAVAVPPPPPAMEAEHHEATPAVVTKEGHTLKIVPAVELLPPAAVEPPAVPPPAASPPAASPPAAAPPAVSPPAPYEPAAPIAPVPVSDDHAATASTTQTTAVEPAATVVPTTAAPVAIEHVASHEATVPKPVPVTPAASIETTRVTPDTKQPAHAAPEAAAHHDSATTTTSGTATPAPSTRTDVTRRTAASLADLPTPTEVFTGHVAEHPTTLVMRDDQIFDQSGEALYRIHGRTFTDKQHAPVFNLRRGHIRRTRWKVKPNGSKRQLHIRARQHYGFFSVPMPPESTSGAKNREAVLRANQLRLGASKSVFENKAIVGMIEDDKMHVAKGFDLALAGAMWKAQTDTHMKHARRQFAIDRFKVKRVGRVKVKSSNASATTV